MKKAKAEAEEYRVTVVFTQAEYERLGALAVLKRKNLYTDGESARSWVLKKALAAYEKRQRRKRGRKHTAKAAKAAKSARVDVAG